MLFIAKHWTASEIENDYFIGAQCYGHFIVMYIRRM